MTAKLVGLDREFPANSQGTFRIMLPGAEIVDYTLSAVYDGMKVSADGETASAVIDFTYGADVTNIRYVLVENELTEAERLSQRSPTDQPRTSTSCRTSP